MKTINSLPPFKRFCVTIGNLPSSYVDSMSYYESLMWLCKYLKDTVIPAINNNAEALEELQQYVTHYFDNLDVQEEINNKLDEMVEDGTLQEIITEYLEINGVLGFNTLNDLVEATNIINGSICRTLGTSTYNDGYGNFYKIRTITSGDVVDGINIIALDISDTLIAELITDTTIANILNELDSNRIKKELHKTKAVKFSALKDGIKVNGVNYYYNRNLESESNALPMISLTNITGTMPVIQGCAVWNKTGQIIYNNSTNIFTMSYTNKPTQTILFTDDYGHGGDACIYEDYMYITDSDDNNIYKVNLQTGAKETYSVSDSVIKNSEHNYNPKLAGICMNNSEFAYIFVLDDESYSVETGHKIQDGSTIRVYKYKFSDSSVTKLFELEQDIVYGQGFTKDEDYFYIIGNKEFTSNYVGNKLHIINLDDFSIYDTLENTIDEEFEGLDYGCTRGYEGLFTICGKHGSSAQYGLLSFNANYLISYENADDSSKKMFYIRKDGLCFVNMYVTGSFTAGSTVTINNVFDNLPKIFTGPVIANSIPILAVSYSGQSRNYMAQVKFDIGDNSLDILTQTGSPDSTYITITFIYPCN